MAKIDFLFQAVTTEFHADALRTLLSTPKLQRLVASVAYVREDGVNAVAAELKPTAKVANFFVGIRNDITSVQAVRRLVNLGIRVYAVDTGARSPIFHPKVFLAKNEGTATAIIGSANLTFNGLHNNIEAGAILHFNLAIAEDASFVDSTLKLFDELPKRFPEHVFEVKDIPAVETLFNDGRLADEDVVLAPCINTSIRKGERDKLRRMKLVQHRAPTRKRKKTGTVKTVTTVPKASPTSSAQPAKFELVWESRGLTERDLNIPTGATTNPTGSMLWKKGAAEDIDQRHFFREEVFDGLVWKKDAAKPHIERTTALFHIIIKGVLQGDFMLKLSHNTDATSISYAQRNSMTQVHWGLALSYIAKKDLLGRIMSLYRKEGNPPEFTIEID